MFNYSLNCKLYLLLGPFLLFFLIIYKNYRPLSTNFTYSYFVKALCRYKRENDGFHGRNISKPNLRDVQGAHHVCPIVGVGAFERPILAGTELTLDTRRAFLRFTFSTKPGTDRNSYNSVTS